MRHRSSRVRLAAPRGSAPWRTPPNLLNPISLPVPRRRFEHELNHAPFHLPPGRLCFAVPRGSAPWRTPSGQSPDTRSISPPRPIAASFPGRTESRTELKSGSIRVDPWRSSQSWPGRPCHIIRDRLPSHGRDGHATSSVTVFPVMAGTAMPHHPRPTSQSWPGRPCHIIRDRLPSHGRDGHATPSVAVFQIMAETAMPHHP
jgi:hypothetical protein